MIIFFKKKKGSKKGGKKIDPFTRKEWYTVRAPGAFFKSGADNKLGFTPVNRTQGTKLASDGLKGRVFEVSLADMKDEESQVYRKIKLRAEDVEGRNVLTNFYGMDLTTDKLRSLIHKWANLIECFVDVKTTDGYVLRVFSICFTKKNEGQKKKTAYAKTSRIKAIRKKMVDIITETVSTNDLKTCVEYFIGGQVTGSSTDHAGQSLTLTEKIRVEISSQYPCHNVYLRKVKVLKAPKMDAVKLSEIYASTPMTSAPVEETGVAVEEVQATA
ncbi:hypothetical protein DICPUDRAFT_98478 [Dictyostelium purpureum]|uniref:Small ribosomal subunit protein eS1 n=1 Tax=Dictyostelium purpureum TaxID=5786 RepID=F0ZQQ6_DICPU|nr:uncharacterized protein DICPUDRAFT_98478 [Dictyostelium purpureum]EGC33723.1 hypothetical protein DICPUDRAFT_98478 [Dictyostelium purpureum]|eukprot:XP_003289762.1 hypothetical protein DICPUDRAFT_98478 [Dictyostelium purpureum]